MKIKIPENLTQRACCAIRDEILQGRLNGQQRLTETFFANKFGVSKSPIREALNRLEAEGLILIEPRRGAFVRHFSMQDVKEIYELCELLEPIAMRQMVLDKQILSRLHVSLQAAKDGLRRQDKDAYLLAEADFHRALARANTNSRLYAILESMYQQALILQHRAFEALNERSVVEHERIVEALEIGKIELASRLMVEHIGSMREDVLTRLQKPGESRPPSLTGRSPHP